MVVYLYSLTPAEDSLDYTVYGPIRQRSWQRGARILEAQYPRRGRLSLFPSRQIPINWCTPLTFCYFIFFSRVNFCQRSRLLCRVQQDSGVYHEVHLWAQIWSTQPLAQQKPHWVERVCACRTATGLFTRAAAKIWATKLTGLISSQYDEIQ